jgi:hypothetical protein
MILPCQPDPPLDEMVYRLGVIKNAQRSLKDIDVVRAVLHSNLVALWPGSRQASTPHDP